MANTTLVAGLKALNRNKQTKTRNVFVFHLGWNHYVGQHGECATFKRRKAN